jgi:hypothetical protein
VWLKERIMIGGEVPRCTLTMDGGVEHAADISARDSPAMHADADKAARELVHHREDPVAPEHDRLAAKEVHAPQAVCGVADERLPQGALPPELGR